MFNKNGIIIFCTVLVLFILLLNIDTSRSEPVFHQKGGMLNKGQWSFYFRTNDEYTSFSTLLLGFRLGHNKWFQTAYEGGLGISTYLFNYLMYFRVYSSKNDRFFAGLRLRSGYKWQSTDIDWFENDHIKTRRSSLYTAPELTFSFRVGKEKRHSIFLTTYFRFDYSFLKRQGYSPWNIWAAPVHLGYEFRFKKHKNWSFAFDTGFYLPVNDIHPDEWINFPNLLNFGFYRVFN